MEQESNLVDVDKLLSVTEYLDQILEGKGTQQGISYAISKQKIDTTVVGGKIMVKLTPKSLAYKPRRDKKRNLELQK